MKLRLELGTVVGLDDVDPKREPLPDLVEELDRGALIAGIVDL
jgi:hypothetical protein